MIKRFIAAMLLIAAFVMDTAALMNIATARRHSLLYVIIISAAFLVYSAYALTRYPVRTFVFYLMVALGAIFFAPVTYALIAVIVTFTAALENLKAEGKIGVLKKLSVYISAGPLLLYNIGLGIAIFLGIYEPHPNLYVVSALVVITVILAARRLFKLVPEGKLGTILSSIMPMMVVIYGAGYLFIKLNTIASLVDGTAKALSALAGLLRYKSSKGEAINFSEGTSE